MVEERAIGVERVGGYQFHMWGPSPYYRSPAHWRHPDGIATIVASIVARGGWISRSDGIWESLTPEGTELPASGWKVHVSATPDAFEPVARAAAGSARTAACPSRCSRTGGCISS
ncbi:hypothetical protein BC477_00785 [Clavibacter michiganensis subsp. michiganensis]|uniref:RamC N-terminal domain-containing protein n=1 Tax=Clavibacter michiganensis subsp. michiganensis TaxID=33013 RepID=A0A251XEP8_CLAMM|nr:hypothetical protein BC477_00785 [Clavibacter michiganensis subsp. michiganensis]OUE00889.1 hypothetical protein CMMCAS07_15735 [Clavibacter michiganensis subsp. michiganensis]